MESVFFFVGKQEEEGGRTKGVRARNESGGVDAWLAPMLESERFEDFDAANTARRTYSGILETELDVYEVKMELSVAKVERPAELKRTTII